MTELFRLWLLGVTAAALILAVVYALVPAGRVRAAIRFTGGLVLLLAVLGPLTRIDQKWSVSYHMSSDEIQRQIDEYLEAQRNRTREIIEEQTAAYISSMGKEWGLECCPSVGTRLEDGVPFPDSVTMDIPYHDGLSARIDAELGIGRDRQIWQER